VFILTERTPNPDAMKFMPHVELNGGAPRSFERSGFEARRSALAARLFEIPAVSRVHVAGDFVTVIRSSGGERWETLRIHVIAAIADHLQSGEPAIGDDAAGPLPGDAADWIEAEIRRLLDLYVRPGVARDGGDILFERFDAADGVLRITMHGACGGCPSSRRTLKAGVERMIRQHLPQVVRVEEAVATRAEAEPSRLKTWATRLGALGSGVRPRFTYRGRDVAQGR
jgi:Fe-S cluster biogenesis protein NfuA